MKQIFCLIWDAHVCLFWSTLQHINLITCRGRYRMMLLSLQFNQI